MRPLTGSLVLYLLMVGLLSVNLNLVQVFPASAYIIYIIVIFAVIFYFSKSLFWGKKPAPGLLIGIALIGIVFLIEIIAGQVRIEGINFNPVLFFSFFILQILVAVGEEISFRGNILQSLSDETGTRTGIILSSFMFSAIHVPSFIYYGLDIQRLTIAFIAVGLLGAIASIIYFNYGLVSAITFHFAWNFLQYNIFNLNRGQGIMNISDTGTNILTGGGFGPEAGVLGLIVVLLALMVLIKKYPKSLN
ncbi:MAG: CPBP family intramembrane metalloprotease [Candidatus Methanoperedens sp.]|nr:CPBP family intramembrane metalloprotease [Candidatus Methanoperedens sp.]MCZ7403774.1 CPBP family intramembrane metalloprotease [Candidatus Methanoperedens sp.]